MRAKLCVNCSFYRKLESPLGLQIGYCAELSTKQKFDAKRHIVINGNFYSKVNETNACPSWQAISGR